MSIDPPPHSLWASAKTIDGHEDSEWTFPVFTARSAALDGVLPQAFWEYVSTYDRTLELLVRHARLAEAGVDPAFLDSVTLGVEWYESGYRARDGRLPMPRRDEPFRGRHSVTAIGWDERGDAIIFRNSWGDWVGDGDGYISREYFEAHVDDVFVMRQASAGPSPKMLDRLRALEKQLPALEAEAVAYRTRNPVAVERVLHDDRVCELWHFQTYSAETEQGVEVLELSNGVRAVARCHLFHRYREGRSVIEEFFVLPRFRRRGYATLLERRAAELAASNGSPVIEAVVYEADASPRTADAAIAFGERRGYVWEPSPSRRPNAVRRAKRSFHGHD